MLPTGVFTPDTGHHACRNLRLRVSPWEGGVSVWPQEAGIWGHPYVLSLGWIFVSYFVYDIALTADWIVCATLFFHRRATFGLTWEEHYSVLVWVSTGIITTEPVEKQT